MYDVRLSEQFDLRQFIPDQGARRSYGRYDLDRCPFHEDRRPSLLIYADGWTCRAGCGSGDIVEWVARTRNLSRAEAYRVVRQGQVPTAVHTAPTPRITRAPEELDQGLGLRYHLALKEREREYFHWRGLTDATIDRFGLGFGVAPGGGPARFTIPVMEQGRLTNVRYRRDDRCPECGSCWTDEPPPEADLFTCLECGHEWVTPDPRGKYFGIAGHNGAGLFNRDTLPGVRWAILCEGEFDAILLCQFGYTAVSSTGGCKSFPPAWRRFFLGLSMLYVVYDQDNGGVEGAALVARIIPKARIVRLPTAHKGDLTNFFRNHQRGEFEALLEEARRPHCYTGSGRLD